MVMSLSVFLQTITFTIITTGTNLYSQMSVGGVVRKHDVLHDERDGLVLGD